MNSKMATPGSIQGGRGNLPNTHFWHDLKKKPVKAHIFFKMAKILHTGNTWFESGGEGGIYQIPTNVVVWKKPPKSPKFIKMAMILHTDNTWLDLGGEGGNLPNTHLWRILKKSHPKMAPKWQRRIGNSNSFTAHRICWSYYQKFVEVVVHNHLCFAS